VWIGQARDVREHPRLRQFTHGGGARLPAVEHETLVAAHGRQLPHPHGDLGDHTERALAADDQLPQVGPGGGRGCDTEPPLAARRRDPHALDHVLEPSVARRRLSGRAGGGETADRGAFERLRHVTQREPVRGEQSLRLRRHDPGLEDGEPRHGVHRHELVEPHEVQHHDRGLVATQSGDATDDGRAAAERHQPDALGRAHLDDLLHLGRVRGHHDRVRHGDLTGSPVPQQVQIGQSACAAEPVVAAGQHVRLPDHLGQRLVRLLGQRGLRHGEGGVRRDRCWTSVKTCARR